MLPSNDDCNNNDQSIFHRPFSNESIEINFKEDDEPLSIFRFPPSSFNHYHHDLELEDHNSFLIKQISYDLLLLQHQESVTPDEIAVLETVTDMADSSNISTESNDDGFSSMECNKRVLRNKRMPSGKRSSSKTDRHSKINTLKGPRNRRMRLSLEVARNFFHLQDMLGYDRGSKTVEWLLIQAKPEIKKLERCRLPEVNYYCGAVGAKTTSSCEGKVEAVVMHEAAAAIGGKLKTKRPLAKALREKARARARERTSKKNFDHESKLLLPADEAAKMKEPGTRTQNKNHSCSSEVLLAEFEQERISSNEQQPVNLGDQDEEFVFDDASVIMENLSPFSVSNYLQTFEIPQEHQFAGFQYFGKP